MFRKKKKDKNESAVTGGQSSYEETMSVIPLASGGSMSSRRVVTESSQVTSRYRQERSVSVFCSSQPGGNVQSLLSTFGSFDKPITSIDGHSSLRSTFGRDRPSLIGALERDARPFPTTSIPFRGNLYTSTSDPRLARAPVTPALAAQNPAAPSMTDFVPTYRHSCVYMGRALIINNIDFLEKKDERKGAKKDSDDLKKLLTMLNFKIEIYTNLKAKEMEKKIKDFSMKDFKNYDISLVVLMSHGNNMDIQGLPNSNVTYVAGTDNVPVLAEAVVDNFVADKCDKNLKGKPKIFIFQCCRGSKDMRVCHDSVPMGRRTHYSDVLVAHSTLPGYVSNRHPENGTWYIQSICDIFKQRYKDYAIEDMLKMVDDSLTTKHPEFAQTSTYESRGFKKCFLYKNGN